MDLTERIYPLIYPLILTENIFSSTCTVQRPGRMLGDPFERDGSMNNASFFLSLNEEDLAVGKLCWHMICWQSAAISQSVGV